MEIVRSVDFRTYCFLSLPGDLVAELLLSRLLHHALPHKFLLVRMYLSVVVAHVVIVLPFVALQLRFMSLLRLVYDRRLDGVRILDHPVILIGLQVRAVKEMLDDLVLALVVCLWHALLLVEVAYLVMRPGQVTLLPLLL